VGSKNNSMANGVKKEFW